MSTHLTHLKGNVMTDSAVAIVLMTTEPGKEVEIIEQIKKINEVKEALVLFGEFDIFLKLQCPDYGYLSSVVVNQIRNIEGVETTTTMTATPTSGSQ